MIRLHPLAPLCPSCARFIGTVIRCPYCDSETGHRRSVILLRCAASALSACGLLLLLLP